MIKGFSKNEFKIKQQNPFTVHTPHLARPATPPPPPARAAADSERESTLKECCDWKAWS